MSKIISRQKVNLSAKKESFPYQVDAFLALKDLPYSAIFHEQGLGKTKIAIDLLLYWLSNKDIDTVLIVTKKQLVYNWVDEFRLHTYIRPSVLSSNKTDNFYVFNSPVKAIITNFETLSTDKDRMRLFLKSRDVAIIIDESTKLKNPAAKLTQDYFELAPLFKIKTIMTGTPVANRPYDIWAQIFFLDSGKSLGTSFQEFKKHTDLTNKLAGNLEKQIDFEEHVSEIYSKISEFSVRETKNSCGISLPKKEYITIYAEFEDRQYSMYQNVIEEMKLLVHQGNTEILDNEEEALKRLLRLNQLTSNPALVDDSYEQIPGKLEELDKLIGRIVLNGDKCIVWSCFIKNVDSLCERYKDFQPRKIHGSMSMDERNKSVSIFKANPECKVLFATPQAAKEGLTLTVANHVIFYDRGFNLDDYLQAQDRIHRITQTKTCYVYNLMIQNSIDEWINKLLQAKQYAAFLAQGDISKTEYNRYADYSYGELIKEILQSGEFDYE